MKTETTNTTTRPAVLLLEADNRAANHRRRIEAAHSRHQLDTSGTWTATTNGIRPPIHCQNGEQLTATADSAAYLAIRARHQSSGLDLMRQLMDSRKADQIARNIATIAAEAIEAERERDTQRAAQHYHEAQAARKTISPAEAKAHRAKAKTARQAADKASKTADSLNKLLKATTSSDRADIVQAALVAALEYNGDPDKAFPALCRAAGKAIAAVASPTTLTSTRTKVKEMTTEEELKKVAELLKAYPNITIIDPTSGEQIEAPQRIPHNVKGATSQCFDTVEQRERGRGKNKKMVWCIISHYLTTPPYISYEAYTEAAGGDTAEIATNGGINAIGTAEDAAAIAQMLLDANLTERETAIVYKVADQTAAHHGQYAADEYWKKRTPEIAALKTPKARREAHKDAQSTADRERIGAQWENALDRSGIYSEDNRRKVKSRIYKKLNHKEPAQPQDITARIIEIEQRSKRRGTPAPAARPDAISLVCPAAVHIAAVLEMVSPARWEYRPAKSAADSASAFTQHKPVVRWTASTSTPATTSGIDYRAAEVMKRDSYRATAPKAQPPALTERERTQREKLVKREEELFALWAEFEKLSGRRPDADPSGLTKADTSTAEATAEAARMRAAAAKLTPAKLAKVK